MERVNKTQAEYTSANATTNDTANATATTDYTKYASQWTKFSEDIMKDIQKQIEKETEEETEVVEEEIETESLLPPTEALVSLGMSATEVDVETNVEPKVINIQYIYADKLIYREQVEVNINNAPVEEQTTKKDDSILSVDELELIKKSLKKEKPEWMTEEHWLDF